MRELTEVENNVVLCGLGLLREQQLAKRNFAAVEKVDEIRSLLAEALVNSAVWEDVMTVVELRSSTYNKQLAEQRLNMSFKSVMERLQAKTSLDYL